MNAIFLVFGYGVPEDILKDENCSFYLKMVFNKIFDVVVNSKIAKPLIIFCGGETDCFKPCKRNEADEMIKFFWMMITERPFLKIKNWQLVAEKKSLSSLENMLFSKKILAKRKIENAKIIIFCEHTRAKRINIIAKKLFVGPYKLQVVPIDFDVSQNRYLDPNFLEKKEKQVLKYDLWALQSPENLKKYHKVFEEKIAYLRKAGTKVHVEAIRKWWEERLKD